MKHLGPDRPQLLTKSGFFHVASQKLGTQNTVDLLTVVTLEKFIAFLAYFLKILNEKKLGPSLVSTTGVVAMLRIA